jgi:hypothetical protein
VADLVAVSVSQIAKWIDLRLSAWGDPLERRQILATITRRMLLAPPIEHKGNADQ